MIEIAIKLLHIDIKINKPSLFIILNYLLTLIIFFNFHIYINSNFVYTISCC
jgi:hypothetical protein